MLRNRKSVGTTETERPCQQQEEYDNDIEAPETSFLTKAGGFLFMLHSILQLWICFLSFSLHFRKDGSARIFNSHVSSTIMVDDEAEQPLLFRIIIPTLEYSFGTDIATNALAFCDREALTFFCVKLGLSGMICLLISYMIYFKGSWFYFLTAIFLSCLSPTSCLMGFPGQDEQKIFSWSANITTLLW